jgi:L-lactate dehydrogenase (cytochrome)
MGRPYLYGLAAAGQSGVESVLASFESELKRNMMLMGVNKLSQLDRSKIRRK